MIRAAVTVGPDGLLQRIEITGHAGHGVSGDDIVCAAVTTLVRSAARLLEGDGRFALSGEAPEPGALSFSVTVGKAADSLPYLRGIGDMLILGLSDITREYPDRCSLHVGQGARNGT